MVIRNEHILTGELLFAEVKNHLSWFGAVVQNMMFNTGDCPDLPESEVMDYLPSTIASEIQGLKSWRQGLQTITLKLQSDGRLTEADLTSLRSLLDSYIGQLKRLERLSLEDSRNEYSEKTGLKGEKLLKLDIARELKRMERQNSPLCVASIQVDQYENVPTFLYKELADVISEFLRAFDDVYYMGRGRYILLLKDVDILDAVRVVDRLRQHVRTSPVKAKWGGQTITLSGGVIEPVPNDNPEEIIRIANETCNDALSAGGNTVFEYNEQSALQKLAQQPQGDV